MIEEDLQLADRRPFGRALCRFPGCDRRATKACWGCPEHWFALSPDLRGALERAARIECRANGRVGKAWIATDAAAQVWLRKHGSLAPPRPRRPGKQRELPL
jgi:hypothetical protein